MNRTLKIALGVLLAAAIAAGSFFAGSVYGKAQAQAASPGTGNAAGRPAGVGQNGVPPSGQAGPGGAQGGMLLGQIESVGDGTLAVTDQSGKQVQVSVTDTTLIQKQATVSLADLAEGDTVMVSGSQAADGSITARSVQVMSAGSMGALPGANPPAGGQLPGNAGSSNP